MTNTGPLTYNVALGYFDGVHIGHRAVINAVPDTAVFTFRNRNVNNITTDETKRKLFTELGVKQICAYDFDAIKDMSPGQFVHDILHNELNAEVICCGYDFRFGAGGQANAEDLTRICGQYGIKTIIIPAVKAGGEPVSSTRIRELIASGGIEAANRLLGYEMHYELEVVGGNKLGRTIGFPTINQNMPPELILPRFGVYTGRVAVHGGCYKGITNIGVKPTAGENKQVTIETHITGFDGDLYGEIIKVSLISFIRPEMKFNSFTELSQQIKEDLKWLK